MSYVFEAFALPMLKRFRLQPDRDRDVLIEDLTRTLERFSLRQLERAASWFVENRDSTTFPTVAECIATVERMPATVDGAAAPGRRRTWESEAEARARVSAEAQARKRAVELVRMSMVKDEARAGGYLAGLLDWVSAHQRLPTWSELEGVRLHAKRTDENLHREPRPLMYASLCTLRQAMHERAVEDVFPEG